METIKELGSIRWEYPVDILRGPYDDSRLGVLIFPVEKCVFFNNKIFHIPEIMFRKMPKAFVYRNEFCLISLYDENTLYIYYKNSVIRWRSKDKIKSFGFLNEKFYVLIGNKLYMSDRIFSAMQVKNLIEDIWDCEEDFDYSKIECDLILVCYNKNGLAAIHSDRVFVWDLEDLEVDSIKFCHVVSDVVRINGNKFIKPML